VEWRDEEEGGRIFRLMKSNECFMEGTLMSSDMQLKQIKFPI
jgi:hypothetical protein